MKWINVNDKLPCKCGEQKDVLFCSPGWGWPIVGMFSHLGDMVEWSEYDQQNDKYILWTAESPTLWMKRPDVPNAAPQPAAENEATGDDGDERNRNR